MRNLVSSLRAVSVAVTVRDVSVGDGLLRFESGDRRTAKFSSERNKCVF